MKYRKKPVVIEAIEFNGTRKWDDAPEWLIEATQKHPESTGSIVVHENETATIATLEGMHTAQKGDMIIRGVQGEIYPCKPDIFKKTYEHFAANA